MKALIPLISVPTMAGKSDMRRRAFPGLVGLVVCGILTFDAGVATAKSSPPRRPVTYTTSLAGSWVVSGCLPTAPPSGSSFPLILTARCIGEVTESWTGYYVDDERAVEDSTLSMHSQGVLSLYGKAEDGTCGRLIIHSTSVTNGANDVIRGTATIVSGTGDWAGSTGRYATSGQFDTIEGNGEYRGVWLRPGKPVHRADTDCVPPSP